MGYSTSVWETWGTCFYNISQQGSLIPFPKIYGLCVQERRLVTTVVSMPPQPVPPHRDPRRSQELQPSPLLAHSEVGGGWWLCSLGWRVPAPGRKKPFDSLSFCLCLITYKSFLHPTNSHQSQQLREHREAQTKAVNGEEWCSQDGSSNITKTLPATLNHSAHILRVWRLSG